MLLGTKLAAAEMIKAGGGSIVNISFIMGFVASLDGHPDYSAAKGAVRLHTKSAAVKYVLQGVRVNSLPPTRRPSSLAYSW